ncbi:MAG: FAD-binding oxidoreductase [bacterium]
MPIEIPASEETDKTKLFLAALQGIVGPEFVAWDPATLYVYSQDLTENEPRWPLGVVMPGSAREVQRIVEEANRFGIPLVPFTYGLNMGGLAIPAREAVIVDLKRMRAILEVNEEDLYIVVEPGVTFGMIRAYLDKHHPGYRYSYPLAPPQTSALSNALMDGLNNMSMRHGAMSDWINGLEVVLPTGELVRVGSAAVVDSWHARVPLPDLAGLFLGWQGASGIVTKGALQIWPVPPLRRRFFIAVYDPRTAYRIMRTLCRKEAFDDLACVSWAAGKMLFGARGRLALCPGEPTLFVYGDLYAENAGHMSVKEQITEDLIREIRREGFIVEDPLDVDDLVRINPNYAKLAEFPTTLDFLLDYGPGGMTWVGSYGPGKNWAQGAEQCFRILEEEGFPPVLVSRPMKGGHFWVLRFILHFDRQDPRDVARTRGTLSRLADCLLELRYVPYKSPAWAVEKLRERDSSGFFQLLERVKSCLDPNGILNPGRWGL